MEKYTINYPTLWKIACRIAYEQDAELLKQWWNIHKDIVKNTCEEKDTVGVYRKYVEYTKRTEEVVDYAPDEDRAWIEAIKFVKCLLSNPSKALVGNKKEVKYIGDGMYKAHVSIIGFDERRDYDVEVIEVSGGVWQFGKIDRRM